MVVLAEIVLALINTIVMLFDVISGWAYRLIYRPDKRVKNFKKVRAGYGLYLQSGYIYWL